MQQEGESVHPVTISLQRNSGLAHQRHPMSAVPSNGLAIPECFYYFYIF